VPLASCPRINLGMQCLFSGSLQSHRLLAIRVQYALKKYTLQKNINLGKTCGERIFRAERRDDLIKSQNQIIEELCVEFVRCDKIIAEQNEGIVELECLLGLGS